MPQAPALSAYWLRLTRTRAGAFRLDSIHPSTGEVIRCIRDSSNLNDLLVLAEERQAHEQAGPVILYRFNLTTTHLPKPEACLTSTLTKLGRNYFEWNAPRLAHVEDNALESLLSRIEKERLDDKSFCLVIKQFKSRY